MRPFLLVAMGNLWEQNRRKAFALNAVWAFDKYLKGAFNFCFFAKFTMVKPRKWFIKATAYTTVCSAYRSVCVMWLWCQMFREDFPGVFEALGAAVLIWCTVWFVKPWSKLAVSLPALRGSPWNRVSSFKLTLKSQRFSHSQSSYEYEYAKRGAQISLPNLFNSCIISVSPLSLSGRQWNSVESGTFCWAVCVLIKR